MIVPPLLVLTDRTQASRPLGDVVAAAVDGGARAVVLREKDLPAADRQPLAEALAALLTQVSGILIVAGRDALTPAAAGVHLAAADALPNGLPDYLPDDLPDDLPATRPPLVGRSCHSVPAVTRAGREGIDYVTVSPVASTPSKPGYGPPLGVAGVAAAVAAPGAPPVYALGGVTAGTVGQWRDAGATGVAVMGAVMRAEHPDRYVASLIDALSEVAA